MEQVLGRIAVEVLLALLVVAVRQLARRLSPA